MRLSAIVAMSENRVIGRDNQLPWRLPADLRHFKALTLGKSILMGRKTHESIGRLLPGRRNIIITRNQQFQVPQALVVHSVEAVLNEICNEDELMIIGGAELYRELLPQTQRIYLTMIHAQIEGDSYFPELTPQEWHKISNEDHPVDTENPYPYSFEIWERLGRLQT